MTKRSTELDARISWLGTLAMLVAFEVAADGTPKGPEVNSRCQWQCIDWHRQCDIDPRGERRCQRRCEKFAKVCDVEH
ncbi:MAG: hypothetical protein EXR86_07825 [Gammaproteobacteria bacterium]|nr:hypothetical protein [Gammaproteobacteria bacterium]